MFARLGYFLEISATLTPCYKKSILGSKQPVCGKCFFGRFLVRLSESDHSRVWSKASFFCARSNQGYEILNGHLMMMMTILVVKSNAAVRKQPLQAHLASEAKAKWKKTNTVENTQIQRQIQHTNKKYKIQIAKYKMSKIYYLKKSCLIVEFSRFSTSFEQLQCQFKFLFFNFLEFFFTVIHIDTQLCLAEEKS